MGVSSTERFRIDLREVDDVVGRILSAAASHRPTFVYERLSSRTRRPVRSYIGFGGRVSEASAKGGADLAPTGFRLALLSYEALTDAPIGGDTPRQLWLEPSALLEVDHEADTLTVRGDSPFSEDALREALADGEKSEANDSDDFRPTPEEATGWLFHPAKEDFADAVGAMKLALSNRAVRGAVLSVQASKDTDIDPLTAYGRLRRINPSTCMFFVESGDFALWGATSLPIMEIRGQRIVAETDGATRRVEPGQDLHWEPNAKEIEEYDLVVSALREDLQPVIEAGSLRFIADREARQFFNLQHLFAEIEGELAPAVDAISALRSLTPHGAASGYPKTAAVELIANYDLKPRGPYGGAVVLFGPEGTVDAACVIRSAWKIGQRVYTRSGAKIVSGSDANEEYEESVMKTLPLRRSVALAGR